MNETLDACESIIVPESRRGVDYCSNTTLDITRSKKGIPNKPTNQPTILSRTRREDEHGPAHVDDWLTQSQEDANESNESSSS